MAVLFLAHMENGEMKNKGLCLKCARDLDIPQVRDVMEKMGLGDEEVEAMSNQMTDLMEKAPEELEGDFEMGGAQPFLFCREPVRESDDSRRATDSLLLKRK
jgi:hypothetical protein